jgi:hypothetical protein
MAGYEKTKRSASCPTGSVSTVKTTASPTSATPKRRKEQQSCSAAERRRTRSAKSVAGRKTKRKPPGTSSREAACPSSDFHSASRSRCSLPSGEQAITGRFRRGRSADLMTMVKLCLHCNCHYEIGTGVRGRCGDCGRAYDRELSRKKRARRARNSARWQRARELARQRDGNRCVRCGGTERLEVHHVVAICGWRRRVRPKQPRNALP